MQRLLYFTGGVIVGCFATLAAFGSNDDDWQQIETMPHKRRYPEPPTSSDEKDGDGEGLSGQTNALM